FFGAQIQFLRRKRGVPFGGKARVDGAGNEQRGFDFGGFSGGVRKGADTDRGAYHKAKRKGFTPRFTGNDGFDVIDLRGKRGVGPQGGGPFPVGVRPVPHKGSGG